ncbi:MAG TPA: WD40 repeat domain-containing protein, partial [Polyangiaceae bacterium]
GLQLLSKLRISGLATTDDGKYLLATWLGSATWRLNLNTWTWDASQLTLPGTNADANAPLVVQSAVRPLQEQIATIDESGRVTLYAMGDGKAVWFWRGATSSFGSSPLAFSHDGKTLAVGGNSESITLLDANDGRKLAEIVAHPASESGLRRIVGLHWLRKSTLLASIGDDRTLRLWDMTQTSTPRLTGLASIFSLPFVFTGLPEDASDSDRKILRDVHARANQLPMIGENVNALDASPDERTIAVAHSDGVSLFDVDTLKRDMEELTKLDGTSLVNEVERRTGLRHDGTKVLPRFWNELIPDTEPPIGR